MVAREPHCSGQLLQVSPLLQWECQGTPGARFFGRGQGLDWDTFDLDLNDAGIGMELLSVY